MRVVGAPPQPAPPPVAQQPEREADAGDAQAEPRQHLAANVLKGFWQVDARQLRTVPRLRANMRMMLVIVGVAVLAAVNALYVPLHLERQISMHPRCALDTRPRTAATTTTLSNHRTALMLSAHAAHNSSTGDVTAAPGDARAFAWPWRAHRPSLISGTAALESMQQAYHGKGCIAPQRLIRCVAHAVASPRPLFSHCIRCHTAM